MKIGTAITTVPKREDLHAKQLEAFDTYGPKHSVLYIHNDWQGIGIAKSKNNCLKALYDLGCTHFFLFDDDIYPIEEGWERKWIDSGLDHGCLTWDINDDGSRREHRKVKVLNGIEYYTSACGVLLYFTRECVERIGGMDLSYEAWGYEHIGLSHRIRNAGIQGFAFACPVGVVDDFWINDKLSMGRGVYSTEEKEAMIKKSKPIVNGEINSSDWKPFRNADYVLTCLYSGIYDQQRKRVAKFDYNVLDTMINSAPCDVLCFTNLKPKQWMKAKYIHSVPMNQNIYNFRFIHYLRWLKKNLEYCNVVYLLDGTDTEFIGKPDKIERGKVYINTEGDRGGVQWLVSHGAAKFGSKAMEARGTDMWNCGVIYGYAEDVIKLLEQMQPYLLGTSKLMDMPALNYVCNVTAQGFEPVPMKSGFKSEDKDGVWIRHK